jgi:hypothetical protein
MNRITKLLGGYEAQLGLVWDAGLHGAEKTWFAVYDPVDERRLRAMTGEFELATIRAGKKWRLFDATTTFESWLAQSEYREAYFEDPDFLEMQYAEFEEHLRRLLRHECVQTDEQTVFAIDGIGSLFGFVRVSNVVSGLADAVKGRLLVFFPGSVEANTYRLLNARDGWNYRAVAIVATR